MITLWLVVLCIAVSFAAAIGLIFTTAAVDVAPLSNAGKADADISVSLQDAA